MGLLGTVLHRLTALTCGSSRARLTHLKLLSITLFALLSMGSSKVRVERIGVIVGKHHHHHEETSRP